MIYILYSLYYSTIGSMPLSEEKGFTLCLYCGVIVQALLTSREPLRYNELHREASKVFGRRIWIKTFNDHLKKLCEISIVVRKEKNRYHVTYELEQKNINAYGRERKNQILKDIEALIELPGGREYFEGIVKAINEKAKQWMKILE